MPSWWVVSPSLRAVLFTLSSSSSSLSSLDNPFSCMSSWSGTNGRTCTRQRGRGVTTNEGEESEGVAGTCGRPTLSNKKKKPPACAVRLDCNLSKAHNLKEEGVEETMQIGV